jgi:hypothetical protein
MPLMRGAGAVILVSRARGRRAIKRGGGSTCAKAVYQEREYRDDADVDTTLHQNRWDQVFPSPGSTLQTSACTVKLKTLSRP